MKDGSSAQLPGDTAIELLILQPTPFCNIDCAYCYLPFRSDKSRMSAEVMAATFKRCADSGYVGDQISLVWHAGEPLVLPPDYYLEAFALAEKHLPEGIRITHCFQTNGMLINDAWCDLLSRPDVTVGVSIDGPKPLHDANRVTRSGKGTWDSAIKGIGKLRAREINFHVISVLTRESLFFPDELFDFYLANGACDICFNVEELEGVHGETSLADPRCEQLYRDFMERFLELANESDEIRSVRDFAQAFGNIMRDKSEEPVNQQTRPLSIVTVAANGDLSTFSPELLGMENDMYGDFVFGNVLESEIAEMLNTDKFKSIYSAIDQGVSKCRAECPYFPVCAGGAPANKLFETGSFEATETIYCRYTVQLLTDVALAACEKELDAERWSAQTARHPVQ